MQGFREVCIASFFSVSKCSLCMRIPLFLEVCMISMSLHLLIYKWGPSQMDVEDPLTEAQRRMQVLVVTKEKEWAAKMEKVCIC